jgi:hypothetical protein
MPCWASALKISLIKAGLSLMPRGGHSCTYSKARLLYMLRAKYPQVKCWAILHGLVLNTPNAPNIASCQPAAPVPIPALVLIFSSRSCFWQQLANREQCCGKPAAAARFACGRPAARRKLQLTITMARLTPLQASAAPADCPPAHAAAASMRVALPGGPGVQQRRPTHGGSISHQGFSSMVHRGM